MTAKQPLHSDRDPLSNDAKWAEVTRTYRDELRDDARPTFPATDRTGMIEHDDPELDWNPLKQLRHWREDHNE